MNEDLKPTDLLPVDVHVEAKDGKYLAILGFLVHQGMPKFYTAWGDTPQQAKEFLADVMKRHIDRAVQAS